MELWLCVECRVGMCVVGDERDGIGQSGHGWVGVRKRYGVVVAGKCAASCGFCCKGRVGMAMCDDERGGWEEMGEERMGEWGERGGGKDGGWGWQAPAQESLLILLLLLRLLRA